jgi:isopropylmalate/homocitrate/citramalate synthase
MKITLTLKEQIDRYAEAEGRKQKWIVDKLNEMGNDITEVAFSRKKNGDADFTEQELKNLSEILGTEIVV